MRLSKAAWFGIPSDGLVYPLGKQTSYTSTTEGMGRRIRYNLSLELDDYCGPRGSMLVFPIGCARDGKSSVKSNFFFPVTVYSSNRYSDNCNVPPPPPPPPPPED